MNNDKQIPHCPIEAAIEFIGGKYKAQILWHLSSGTLRFTQLRKLLPRSTPKMMTQQLRESERDGLVIREVYPVVPPKVEYSLSDFGRSFMPILLVMCNWGTGYFKGQKSAM